MRTMDGMHAWSRGGVEKKAEPRACGLAALAILTRLQGSATREKVPAERIVASHVLRAAEAPAVGAYLLRCEFSTAYRCFLYSGRSVAR